MPTSWPPPSPAEVQRSHPTQVLDAWLAGLCWLCVAFCTLQVVLFSFGRDQSIYATVAQEVLRGGLPYRDAWDFKPPGIFLIYASAFAALGSNMMAPRLLEGACLLLVVVGCRRLGGALFGSRQAGLLGGALAALLHAQLEFWHTGQPETFAGVLTVAALALTASPPSRRAALRWTGVGLCFGAAFLLKPPLAGGALVCAAALTRRLRQQGATRAQLLAPSLWIGLGALAPSVLCLSWLILGGGGDALRWTLGEFAPGYTALSWQGQSAPTLLYQAFTEAFTRFSALIAVGSLGLVLLPAQSPREREGLLLILGVVSVQLTGVALQAKFFAYHYAATLPLLALLAGVGLYKLWRRLASGGAAGLYAFVTFLVVLISMRQAVTDLPGGFWRRAVLRTAYLAGQGPLASRGDLDRALSQVGDYSLAANREVAQAVARSVAPGERLFVWGFEPGIYWMSATPPSSRFIYDVPQRGRWQRAAARTALMHDLISHPPQVVVVQHGDVFPAVTGGAEDSAQSLQGFDELRRWLDAGYTYTHSIEAFDLYERNSAPPL